MSATEAVAALVRDLGAFPVLGGLLVAWLAVREAGLWFLRFVPRDSQRLYDRDQRSAALRRAGYRCEHRWVILFRCRKTNRLQVDHIWPWSRGGRTSLRNASMLCGKHNRRKSNHVPSLFYRWSLTFSRSDRPTYRRGA